MRRKVDKRKVHHAVVTEGGLLIAACGQSARNDVAGSDAPTLRKRRDLVDCRACVRLLDAATGDPWLVFVGTTVSLVWAPTKRGALRFFHEAWAEKHHGVPPAKHEVRARRLRPTDVWWLRDEVGDNPKWRRALEHVEKLAA